MLLQVLGQFLGNTLPGAKLLFDVGQLPARLLEQKLAHCKVDGGVNIYEQKHCKQEDLGTVAFDQ